MKVAVFIDNSNVFRSIKIVRDNGDYSWPSFYNPLELAKKLAGGRDLAEVNFYCTRPPAYLLNEDIRHQEIYTKTNKYYATIEKLASVNVKYGNLNGPRGNTIEKNLDTQITADLVTGAALSKYDVAIIVSNDGDYVSAVESIKKFGKKVEVVFFKGGLSMHLKRVSDITRRARKSFFVPLVFDKNISKQSSSKLPI